MIDKEKDKYKVTKNKRLKSKESLTFIYRYKLCN